MIVGTECSGERKAYAGGAREGWELPPGDDGHEGSGFHGRPARAVSWHGRWTRARSDRSWTGRRRWREVRTRRPAGRPRYIWLNLVEQRLRAVVAAVLRPIYEPVHGDDWVVAAAGPAGRSGCSRGRGARGQPPQGLSARPADDNVLSFSRCRSCAS
ncbi:hypothetical protein GCM10023238_07250 [Streptomyces heliomycini]